MSGTRDRPETYGQPNGWHVSEKGVDNAEFEGSEYRRYFGLGFTFGGIHRKFCPKGCRRGRLWRRRRWRRPPRRRRWRRPLWRGRWRWWRRRPLWRRLWRRRPLWRRRALWRPPLLWLRRRLLWRLLSLRLWWLLRR